mmetsp:Transcript_27716/g.65322  ORF Transcript_27716/g.65322 Transcript_27716/m.65322 type:complete len:277 (+) Transcript_27716:523-1353(+)
MSAMRRLFCSGCTPLLIASASCRARARTSGSRGSRRSLSGKHSSRNSMIARLWLSWTVLPSNESKNSKTGTCCIGLTALWSSVRFSSFLRLTATYSYLTRLAASAMRTRQLHVDRQYEKSLNEWKRSVGGNGTGVGSVAVGGEAASGSTVPAGRTVPCTDPNPIRRPVELRQLPVMTTESPSSRNFRVWPLVPRGREPPAFQLSSSMLPSESGEGPLMVPVPSRSPGRMLQPVTVWCTSCCRMFQYRCFMLLLLTTARSAISLPWIDTSSATSKLS